jgi:hypothetical protein
MLPPASDILDAALRGAFLIDYVKFIGRSAEFLDLSLKLAIAADSVVD